MIYQIHQVGIPNGSVYQFLTSKGSIYESVSGVIFNNSLNYRLYDPLATPLYRVVIKESGCAQYVDWNGGRGNGTDRFTVCKITSGGYNVTNKNTSITNIGSPLPINYSVYFANGTIAKDILVNFSADPPQITNIFNSSLLEVPTNDSYTVVQYYLPAGILYYTVNSSMECKYPECNTTYAFYKLALIKNNTLLLNSTLSYRFNKSLDGFESPYVYETVQNLTDGASLVNFYSKGFNETVTNNLGEGEISYDINSPYIDEMINNYPINYTIGYKITSPIANVTLNLGYNVSEAVQYNNGTTIYDPTSAEISEAYYSNPSIGGTIPIYHLSYNNITVKLTKNTTYQMKNNVITYSTPICNLTINNASFETGIINLNANVVPGIILKCGQEALNIGSEGGSLGTGLGKNDFSIIYALMPNENIIQSQINYSESIFQDYQSGSFGDQIDISVLQNNGSKETESQVFPVKNTKAGYSYGIDNLTTPHYTLLQYSLNLVFLTVIIGRFIIMDIRLAIYLESP